MAGGGKSGIFSFDHFKLDSDKLMLYRDDVEVAIPPKVAKTLAVLVESAGTILTKEEVIERVWDDSIVEESNLTQYLYLLRKTLGKMPDGRPYIETLRRRGYRFNGHVEWSAPEVTQPTITTRPPPEPAASFSGFEREGNVLRVVDWRASEPDPERVLPEVKPLPAIPEPQVTRRKPWYPSLAIAGLLLLAVGGTTLLFRWPTLMPAATNAESQNEISVVKLTNGLTPLGATISPDGNVFVYHELEGDISRLFVQQTGQPSRIEIARTTDRTFGAKTFSPDGQSIYYIGVDKKARIFSLYRIPAMGGATVKILDDINGPVTFSPDGNEIAFTRYNKSGESSIVISGPDGNAQRVLLHRKGPVSLVSSVSWSPDGKVIAFGEQTFDKGRAYARSRLNLVDVSSGTVTQVSEENWDNILRLHWQPDGTGIVMIATRENEGYSTNRDQVYFVSYPGGVSKRLTSDGNRHDTDSLGVTKKGEILSVSANRSSQVWVMNPDGNAMSATQLTKGTADGRAGLGPLPDGRFGYLARNADEISVMLASPDGAETKQLATGFQFVEELRADPQGRFFVFSSSKDRNSFLYRLDIESGAVKQLTFGEHAIDSTISPDGKFLVYDFSRFENNIQVFSLMRIPTDGGEPVTLKSKGCFLPTYSPDGSLLSCADNEKLGIVIVSARDGSELERHPLPVFAIWNFGIGWTPDGSGLIYIVTEKGTSNLWIQPRDGSKPRSLTNFTSGTIWRYAFAPDGSKLYVARGYPAQDAILIKNYR